MHKNNMKVASIVSESTQKSCDGYDEHEIRKRTLNSTII